MRTGMLAAWAAMAVAVAALPAVAQLPDIGDRPILFTADEMTHDPETELTTARGNVEVVVDDRILIADTITYDQPNNLMTAEGNIAYLDPDGNVMFADYMEVTGDLKDATVENFKLVLEDGARVAAARGTHVDGVQTNVSKGVYSPCFLCPDEPETRPLWQIKAVRVSHNREDKEIEFSHAFLEIAGVPVFYTPYLSLPDPTVRRKTGLLVPTIGTSSDFGFILQAPFYWVISPQQDLTLTPWITSKEGGLLEAEYRQAFTNGLSETSGSITRDSEEKTRGHIFSETRYDIDDTFRAGLDVNRSSDRTYLRRYGFGSQRTLTSRLFTEGFWSRNYLVANGYAFDAQARNVNQDEVPLVAPFVDYFYQSRPDPIGGRADVNLDVAVLTRDKGQDTRRMSVRGGYQLPFRDLIGSVYTFSAALWGDMYNVHNYDIPNKDKQFSGNQGRLFPQGGLQWRLPFVNDSETFQQVVEPKVEFIAAPNYGDFDKIPDEDSEAFEFDEGNIFGFRRFPGYDRVEEGSRFNYGVDWGGTGATSGYANVFVGQSYRLKTSENFAEGSGLSDNFSDYIGVVRLSPGEIFDVLYRTRLDNNDLTPRRHEVNGHVGTDVFLLDAGYVMFEKNAQDDEFERREEVDLSLTTQLTRHWRTRTFGVGELTNGGTLREAGLRLSYEDECLEFSAEYSRENFDDRDIDQSDAIFFRLSFKTLGDVGTGFKTGG